MGEFELTILATGNKWDAPAYVTYYADGGVKSLSREEPVEMTAPYAYFPHALVMVNGQMSTFDADRQPALCPSCGDNGDCGETGFECGHEFHGDGRH